MEGGRVKVEDTAPFLSFGIYKHYHASVSDDGKTVKFVPTFLFGIPQTVLEKFYKGAEGRSRCQVICLINSNNFVLSFPDLPLRGLFLKSVTGDRLIVQTFMLCVGCTVVWILRSQEK